MTAFKSKWADWEPDTLSQRTDKTDKRTSVSFVSTSPTQIQGKIVDSDREGITPDASTQRTDRTDKWSERDVAAAGGGDEQEVSEERAAIIEYDADVPREWAEGFARLCVMPRHPDFTEDRWKTLIGDAGRFMDRWATPVAAMGWTTHEVFGVHPDKPDARIDFQGLVPCIGGNKVVVVSADSVTIQTPTGARQRVFRRSDQYSEGRVLIWEVEGT